ncbi:MAG: glucose-6-phosphate isomerase [Actinomycetota bacterium]
MPEGIPVEASLDHPLQGAVDARLRLMEEDRVVPRMWARDHTVWREDPAEIVDRLGWLTAPHSSRAQVPEVRAIAEGAAADGLTHAVVLGMGGSSLAPEVLRATLGVAPGGLDLRVLDSTHPGAIAALERDVPLDRTLFVVSSKSGTTIETRSHMAYFLDRVGDPRRFVAVTDPGTPLEADARDRGFRAVVTATADVGGRYSALTAFGLLPAALIRADVDALLESAAGAAAACGGAVGIHANPGAVAGAILGEAALAGRDKLTLRPPDPVAALGGWIEQLVAESTGKEGTGIVPVDGEPAVPGVAADRLFLALAKETPPQPWVRLPLGDPVQLGAAFFVLEFATAVAGHVLGIHPFDQPDVQSAKDRTSEVLAAGEVPAEPPGDVDALLGSVRPGDYVTIQAFVAPGEETHRSLQSARARIRDRLGVATTLGYGPRYLHSTGQLHKGGPNTGLFVQVFDEPGEDRPVPGEPFTFGRLFAAQAAGDLAALREGGRRVARVAMEDLLAWDGSAPLGLTEGDPEKEEG